MEKVYFVYSVKYTTQKGADVVSMMRLIPERAAKKAALSRQLRKIIPTTKQSSEERRKAFADTLDAFNEIEGPQEKYEVPHGSLAFGQVVNEIPEKAKKHEKEEELIH